MSGKGPTCDARIWPSWAGSWLRCGQPIINGQCAKYDHKPESAPEPTPAAPVVQGADEMRERAVEAVRQLHVRSVGFSRPSWTEIVNAAFDEIALAQLLAERDELRAKVARVEELADDMDREMAEAGFILDRIVLPGDRLRRALSGENQ